MQKDRDVEVYILCSPMFEAEDYVHKLQDYQDVLRYDKLINSLALDS